MGRNKADLVFQGKTLLQHQYDKLSLVCGEQNVVVSGDYPAFRHLKDLQSDLGPIGGITSIITQFPLIHYFLFLPIDMPNITPQTLSLLFEIAKQDLVSGCCAFENFEMPIIIKNRMGLTECFRDFIMEPRSLRSVKFLGEILNLNQIPTTSISLSEFINTNTSQEWEELEKGLT
jgi:molybdopterin-guanine dinucleotide biosynthesis protein A